MILILIANDLLVKLLNFLEKSSFCVPFPRNFDASKNLSFLLLAIPLVSISCPPSS